MCFKKKSFSIKFLSNSAICDTCFTLSTLKYKEDKIDMLNILFSERINFSSTIVFKLSREEILNHLQLKHSSRGIANTNAIATELDKNGEGTLDPFLIIQAQCFKRST